VALFILSHIFSIITHEQLLTELCELIFFVSDENVLNQMCSRVNKSSQSLSTDVDYLVEPKPLIHCLSSLGTPSSQHQPRAMNSQLTSKSRSHSVPHFSHLTEAPITPDSSLVAAAVDSARTEVKPDVDEFKSLDVAMSLAPIGIIDIGESQSDFDRQLIEKLDLITPIGDASGVRNVKTMNNISSAETGVENNITDDEKFRQIVSHRSNFKNQTYG
jgi:hypothetical protein